MTRWLITGAGGLLGRGLVAALAGEDVVGLAHAELDIIDAAAVGDAVRGMDVVVNAAAWTDVDAAEGDEDSARRVNADGPANLAAACRAVGARLVHVSTDYVFAGDARSPYEEDAAPAPVNAYGRTKLAGERAVCSALPDAGFVVRTAWLYGEHGPSFVRTVARLARERDVFDVVADQTGQPTWTRDLADALMALARSAAPAGVYHATSAGATTRFGLARAVLEELGADPDRARPVPSDRQRRRAARPPYTALGDRRWRAAGLPPLPHWRAALSAAAPTVLRPSAAG